MADNEKISPAWEGECPRANACWCECVCALARACTRVCMRLCACTLPWPSTSLHGGTSKGAFTEFLLLYLLLLVSVSVYLCVCAM